MVILLNENGYVESFCTLGGLVGGIDVSEPSDLDHFQEHFLAYRLENDKLVFDNSYEASLRNEEELITLREQRALECFPIINRGQLWYSTLTETQLDELSVWYNSWLDVTKTKIIPEKPDWLN